MSQRNSLVQSSIVTSAKATLSFQVLQHTLIQPKRTLSANSHQKVMLYIKIYVSETIWAWYVYPSVTAWTPESAAKRYQLLTWSILYDDLLHALRTSFIKFMFPDLINEVRNLSNDDKDIYSILSWNDAFQQTQNKSTTPEWRPWTPAETYLHYYICIF